MGFTRRKLASRKKASDRELLLSFLRGDIGVDVLARRNVFFACGPAPGYTQLGVLAREIWLEHGPRELRKVRGEMPERLRGWIEQYGWPPGDWERQKAALEASRERFKAELREIATKHQRNP